MSESRFYLKGDNEWEQGNLSSAASWFRIGYKHNHIKCVVNLGYFYDLGLHYKENKKIAIGLYKKAMSLGDLAVMQNIALAYRDMGDKVNSALWFSKSAENTHPNDLFLLSFRTAYKENPRKLKIHPDSRYV